MPSKSIKLSDMRFSPVFEFFITKTLEDCQSILNNSGFRWHASSHPTLSNVCVVKPHDENELRSNKGLDESEEVVDLLREKAGATQSDKTGFYIHWHLLDKDGVGIMSPKQLTNTIVDWYNFIRIIEMILPESRRGDDLENLRGINLYEIDSLIQRARNVGEDNKEAMTNFLDKPLNGNLSDIHIDTRLKTLVFRKGIIIVDKILLRLWMEFTRNFTKFRMKAYKDGKPVFKNFVTIMKDTNERLSLTADEGLVWSFRQVFEYRAGNLGLLETAEEVAITLAKRDTVIQDAILGITNKIKKRYHRN